MKLSVQALALLTLSLSATGLAGGCAEDADDGEIPGEAPADPEQDLAPLTEADADGGATQAPVADAGAGKKTESKRNSEPCPACGLG